MTYTVQPTGQPDPDPNIRIKGDVTGAVIWVGAVLLVLGVALLFRRRPKGK